MLLTPRVYQLSQDPDKDSSALGTPFIKCSPSLQEQKAASRHFYQMLLVHQTGSVKVGEVVRYVELNTQFQAVDICLRSDCSYTLTYDPAADRILPSPPHLHVKIKNTSAAPLRAAYLHGPYTIHVAAYPSHFNPNHKLENTKRDGVPQFEPNLKAGGSFSARLTVPEDIRLTGLPREPDGEEKNTVTWIIEISSQILFSLTAEVKFELLISRDERSLDHNYSMVQSLGHGPPGHIRDHQKGKRQLNGHHHAQPKGVFSKAVTLTVDDTDSLWDTPKLPTWEEHMKLTRTSADVPRRISLDLRRKSTEVKDLESEDKSKPKKKRKIHLVILTHGIHSNVGADMLYLKESIDASAKQARENARKRRAEARATSSQPTSESSEPQTKDAKDTSTAPLSGGQQDLQNEPEDDEDEEVIVRGFRGNATKTERGIQWLGKRLAKYVFELTYPDQPFKPVKRSMTQKFSGSLGSRSPGETSDPEDGVPAHSGSTIRQDSTDKMDLPYTFTSISFISHSLGGLVQLYAIGYIQKHAPYFFQQIKPVNFVAMASPYLGLSNENPMYVKFALDFGLVGRTGQDLGLMWRPPTIAKSGWSAMIGGLGIGEDGNKQEDPGAKPLLRILPTGPAHRVLRMFRNRTVYSNVVNDGIVPLRTSCLLFLDWRGLDRVEKARRESGFVGTMANWTWSELTGQSSSANLSKLPTADEDELVEGDEQSEDYRHQSDVPQPAENATNEGDKNSTAIPKGHHVVQQHIVSPPGARKPSTPSERSPRAMDEIWNFFKPAQKTTKKDIKMFKRSQTLLSDSDGSNPTSPRLPGSEVDVSNDRRQSTPPVGGSANGRPTATRGDSLENADNPSAPPKTSIFDSVGDILSPPIPPLSWVIDPSTRTRTIFHDRIYHPEDIPPPPVLKSRKKSSGVDLTSETPESTNPAERPGSSGGMRVEEKIARAYHKDLSWRKVLVRLEPDAHNNMIVRRMFANAYGWPVIKHLCDTHFGDTYAAVTRDEYEPATDRAKAVDQPVDADGEHVRGQESRSSPPHQATDMREDADELSPLKSPTYGARVSASASAAGSPSLSRSGDSMSSWDSRYFRDDDDDDDDDDDSNRKSALSFIRPPRPSHQPKRPSKSRLDSNDELPGVAGFFTEEPPPMTPPLEGHRGLGVLPMAPGPKAPVRTTADVGLRKSLEETIRPDADGAKNRGGNANDGGAS